MRRGELVRIYLVNVLEFDPLNSFHIHANFFHYYPTGHLARADRVHGHGVQGAGPARDPRAALPLSRAGTCSTPTSASSPSSAGWASSRWSPDGGRAAHRAPASRRARCRRGCSACVPAGPDRAAPSALSRSWAAPGLGDRTRPAGRGAGGRAHRPASRRDRAHGAKRRPGPGRDRPGHGQRRLRPVHGQRRARASAGSGRRRSTSPTRGSRARPTRSPCSPRPGGTIEHEIPVAAETPEAEPSFFGADGAARASTSA